MVIGKTPTNDICGYFSDKNPTPCRMMGYEECCGRCPKHRQAEMRREGDQKRAKEAREAKRRIAELEAQLALERKAVTEANKGFKKALDRRDQLIMALLATRESTKEIVDEAETLAGAPARGKKRKHEEEEVEQAVLLDELDKRRKLIDASAPVPCQALGCWIEMLNASPTIVHEATDEERASKAFPCIFVSAEEIEKHAKPGKIICFKELPDVRILTQTYKKHQGEPGVYVAHLAKYDKGHRERRLFLIDSKSKVPVGSACDLIAYDECPKTGNLMVSPLTHEFRAEEIALEHRRALRRITSSK